MVYPAGWARSEHTLDVWGAIHDSILATHILIVIAHFRAVNRLNFIHGLHLVDLIHDFLELGLRDIILVQYDIKCELPNIMILLIGEVKLCLASLALLLQQHGLLLAGELVQLLSHRLCQESWHFLILPFTRVLYISIVCVLR